MENPILSDPNYFRDLELILASIFDDQNLSKQPKYLIKIGSKDGITLRHAYNYILSQTYRGKKISDYPLEAVSLVTDEKLKEQIENNLLGIPHQTASLKKIDIEHIKEALKSLHINDLRLALYLEFFTNENALPFKDYTKLPTQFGFIELHFQQDAATSFIEAAKLGWFPKSGTCFYYPKTQPNTRATLNYFQQQPFIVRIATPNDLSSILHIEQVSHPEALRLPQTFIETLIKEYPEGQLVLEFQGKVKGFALSRRISEQESYLEQNHNPKGSFSQLIALNLLPEKHSLEDAFLEFFLQRTLATSGITSVISLLSCLNYPGSDVISMESYVEELKNEKGAADLAIGLYVKHGAEIIKPVPNYRPKDEKNLGYGVLIRFLKESRNVPIQQNSTTIPFEEELTEDSLAKNVDRIIEIFLAQRSEKNAVPYHRSVSFAAMGLESLHLLELRVILTKEFSIDLPINFFILHPNPEAIIRFLIDTKLDLYKDWLYETKWEPTQKPKFQILPPEKTWIIFMDSREEIGPPIRDTLFENRQKCITVSASDSFEKIDDSNFTIRSTNTEDFERLFSMISNLENLKGIIYLWGIEEAGSGEESSLNTLEEFHHSSLEGLILLVNHMASLKKLDSPKLWVITQTIVTDGNIASLSEWPLNGLCKIIREEYGKFQCCYVALDSQENPSEASQTLFEEISSESTEQQIAFRKGIRLAPRMVRSEVKTVRIPKFSSKASYLIAGGFRNLGILLAKWYISHGARHLILLDEIEIRPEISNSIEELRKTAQDIQIVKIDLSNEDSLKEVLDKIHRDSPPLQGVIHVAGLVDNDLILHMNWSRLMSVHRLKVSLSWNLHRFTQQFNLDHFILFSSCLPDLNPLGLANHATGNSFVDVLSHYRRKRALPSLTINWGPWDIGSMDVKKVSQNKSSDRVIMLKIEMGLRALDHLFYTHKPQITAVLVNWPSLLQNVGDNNPLFEEIAVEMGFKRVDILNKYMNALPEEKKALLQNYLQEKIRRLLKLRSSHELETNKNFKDIGMTISMISNLKNLIQFDLQEAIRLPFNFIEENKNLDQLTQALSKALDETIQSKPKTKMQEPFAVLGIENNKVSLEVVKQEEVKIKIEELSEQLLNSLQKKIQNKEKPTIITIEKNVSE